MAVEIERKFLVSGSDYRSMATESTRIMQGYLSTQLRATVRVRLRGSQAYLTIKGANLGLVRDEWEYAVPLEDARQMLAHCATGSVIDKERFVVPYDGHVWEVDEFHGHYEGLVVAEVELSRPDEPLSLPAFVGREVTGNTRYYNSVMASTDHLRVVDGRLV